MSNEAAERLIPEIARINHISNVKNLKVGQVLLIPTKGKERAAKTEKGGKPQQQEPPEAAAMLDAASKLEPPRAPEPRAPEPVAPEPVAPAAPQAPPAPAASAEPTWICSVNEKDSGKVVDDVLNALSISWTRNKIIESGEQAPNPYSIRVDRYFEHKGGRYIISIGATDPYSYTLIRLLESSGYRTLTVEPSEDFKTVTEKLLRLIGVAPDFGTHPLQGGKESKGFLIQQEDAAGRRVLLTGEKVDPRQRWLMKPGCLVK
jgi:hypothetical protein